MRAAVVGTGHLGKIHARVYSELDSVELTGVYDIDPAVSAETAKALGCEAFSSLEQLLEKTDAVSICVPTPVHAEVAFRCLEAGTHVFVEKPICDDLADARRLRDLASARRRTLQVGHIERFNPAMQAASEHLKNPRFIECHRMSQFGRRGSDVAVVLDLMIHDLDLLLSVIGEEVASIDASGVSVLSGTTDIANARLTFRNGCVANVTASRISMDRMRKLRFFQPDSYVSVDLMRGKVAMYRKRPGFSATSFQSALMRGENVDLLQAIEPVALHVHREEPMKLELSSFVEAVRTGAKPRVGAEEGIRALEVAMEIERLLR